MKKLQGKVFIILAQTRDIYQAIRRKRNLKTMGLNQWSFPPYLVVSINTRKEKLKCIA